MTHCSLSPASGTRRQIIRQNGGGAFSLQTSGLVWVVAQYFKRPSCVATAGKPGSANVLRMLRSQKSAGPGSSCVVASRVAIWKASWFAPRSASSFATAPLCWSSSQREEGAGQLVPSLRNHATPVRDRFSSRAARWSSEIVNVASSRRLVSLGLDCLVRREPFRKARRFGARSIAASK